MDSLESSFVSEMRGLNKKRSEQLIKRATRLLPELLTASESNNKELIENLLKGLQMPSSKEYRKKLHSMHLASIQAGILRADSELSRLRELYTFSEEINVLQGGYYFDVQLPKGAQEWIRDYSYQIGVITEETVLEQIREALQEGLEKGLGADQLKKLIQDKASIWLSDGHAETIARVETAKMYNTGRLARFRDPDNDGFVEALQYDAIVDTRTTELCRHLDGLIVPIDDQATINKYSPPNHFNCRATWIPVTRFEDWEPTFNTDIEPQKGFAHESTQEDKLLKGKEEPLVKIKDRIEEATNVSDPELLRKLSDEDFYNNIANVTDTKVKLSLMNERAEQMLNAETDILDLGKDSFYNISEGNFYRAQGVAGLEYKWKANGLYYQGYVTQSMKPDIEQLMSKLKENSFLPRKDAEKLINEFIADHKHARWLTFNNALRESLKGGTSFVWKGLKANENPSKELLKAFTVRKPARGGSYSSESPLFRNVPKAEEWLARNLDIKTATGQTIQLVLERRLRAFARPATHSVHFNPSKADTRTVVHEIGHLIHSTNPAIMKLVEEFYKKRTDGDKLTKLYGEPTKRDSFFDPYVGRVYGWEQQDQLGQEVLSMGLELMYADPEAFYKRDKEHFLLIYGIMRGLF